LSQMQVSYPFSFIVMGDCQPYDGQLLNETFLEILIQIAELTVPPTFVIICGDLTEYGSELGYIAYSGCISDWMDTTGIPFYSLPGNHEFYGNYSFEYYMTYVGPELDYYFDYGNSRFIAINDVQHPNNLYYHINETQLDSVGVWLSTGPENKFAFNHVSIIRDHHGGGFGNMGYEAFHDSLCFYEAVADFNGHHHDYYRHDLDGIYYLTTSGAGGDTGGIFYPPLSYDSHHWLLITVNELNNIFLEMYFYDAGHNATASLYDFQIQPMQIPPTIYINEFMASNRETIADPQGDYDDWIEIYNADIYPVDIGGMYITDDLSDPAKWKIPDTQPDSTTIQPGEFLLLWADEDIEDGVLHLDIKLSVNGEEIGLYTDDLTSIIDSIVFEEQAIDISFGRQPDGSNNWCQMNPTPGYSNNLILSEDFIFNSPLLDVMNYPNPFNPETTIYYQLPEDSPVEISIYNLKGQKVKTLISDQLSAGEHSVAWNGNDDFGEPVSSGIYFYRIKNSSCEIVKKMVLMK
ncbi:MAG: lamin tail domain-containing protein, partial [Candidatus Cloacimonetes bacterium]|nr:lamin tail domain-containing protein [Candidatus Cloacimonadota bacterium]